MKFTPVFLTLLAVGLTACGPVSSPVATSSSPTEFTLDLRNTNQPDTLIAAGHLEGRKARIAFQEVAGENALEIKTDKEFSDVLINCESLFGHRLKFDQAGWLRMRLYVPEQSWIRAMKLNFADAEGNHAGVSEVANNFLGRYDEWFEVIVDVQELNERYQNWRGDENLLVDLPFLSLNPYCGHQEDSSRIFISYLELSDEKPTGSFAPAYADWPKVADNTRFEFTFDDPQVLHDQMAYRTFESSNQAMARGVGGNESMSIRLRGREYLRNIAFLPILEEATGGPVDFNAVDSIYFDYYLTPESVPFNGSVLTMVTTHWKSIIADSSLYNDFVPGEWQRVALAMDDLELVRAKGTEDVLSQVAELRLNLAYYPGKKNVEMWVDNFGWK